MLKRSKKCVYNKAANGRKTTKKGSGDITYTREFFRGFVYIFFKEICLEL